MARPQKVTDEELIKASEQYIEECKKNDDIPIVKEFTLNMGISSNRLYERMKDNEELSMSIKRITDYKEVVLEKGALTGKYNPTMAIFSLKQMGWKDKWDEIEEKEKEESGVVMMPQVKEVTADE